MDVDEYLTRLASSDPTPGGGSAACLTGALAAALIAMVARITLASHRHIAVRGEAEALIGAADELRSRFERARSEDERAYGAVVAAQTLPRGSENEAAARTAALQAALRGAAEAPLGAAALAAEAAALALRAAQLGNTHLTSDVDCATRFARAALDASRANVEVNHRYLRDAALIEEQRRHLEAIAEQQRRAETLTLERLAA